MYEEADMVLLNVPYIAGSTEGSILSPYNVCVIFERFAVYSPKWVYYNWWHKCNVTNVHWALIYGSTVRIDRGLPEHYAQDVWLLYQWKLTVKLDKSNTLINEMWFWGQQGHWYK